MMVDEITEGFEDLQLDHPIGEGETRLGSALKTPCLWRKGAHQPSELDASASSSSFGESGHSASSTASSSGE